MPSYKSYLIITRGSRFANTIVLDHATDKTTQTKQPYSHLIKEATVASDGTFRGLKPTQIYIRKGSVNIQIPGIYYQIKQNKKKTI